MKRVINVVLLLCLCSPVFSQTAVTMATQTNYTYTETFADISNWAFNTSPQDGTLISGAGAMAWKGYDPGGTGTIPNGTRITHSTTSFQTTSGPGSSSGIYKQSQSIGLISTGTTNNSSAVAFDLFLDFTSLNAGTLSFDWASLNNSTGDRKGSMKVYTSTDGVTFTDLSGASVLNFTNNSPTSGQISFIQLPASFNNSATAQIRFYYYNGTGGTTGSRPKLQLDNVKVTAVPPASCIAPTGQPTSLNLSPGFSTTTGSFSAASVAVDGYLVIRSVNNSLSSLPVSGINYAEGTSVGDGTVVSMGTATSFSSSNLSPSTTYYYFIFAVNYLCTGGPLYNTTSPLIGAATTLSGNTPCSAPANQPTNLVLSNITTNSIRGTFTASTSGNADKYLIVRSTNPALSASPINGTQYYPSSNLGGGVVVTKTPLTSFTANALAAGTQYYFFVFAVNEDNCLNGPAYNAVSALSGSATTVVIPPCTTPPAQPTLLQLTASNNAINGYFTPAPGADGYLVVYSTSSALSTGPQNGTNYAAGAVLGNGVVLSNTATTSFILPNLGVTTQYHFFIFAKKDQCVGGPLYLSPAPLTGAATTLATAAANYYFGNLHAHSAYSDGNVGQSSLTPADCYAYAKNSQCMDFLGLSEHNHSEAGMSINNWGPALAQANAATTSNFLALYGMEWGVISNGGHVLVYGVDQLLGWESGNYNVFVPKSDYTGKPSTTGTTGLFKTINDWPTTAFAMLAHPDNTDFNNIANLTLSPTADSAIAGCAIESGPAFSTNTSYTDPASRLSTYWYFKKLLSRGYRVGPNIDHDNHYTTFGRTNYSRLAVISPSLAKEDFLQAVKNRHFYATHDCDIRVRFTLNNQLMGSDFAGTTPPAISVHVADPTNPTAVPKIRLLYGVPGNLIEAVAIDSINGSTFNYTDFNMPDGAAYYFVEVIVGGGYVVTSPIWYTKSTITPVTLLSFTGTLSTDKTVKLDWKTVNEFASRHFIVEHSTDGVKFTSFDSVATRNSASENVYSTVHKTPSAGINYYRLKQVDIDGAYRYSNTITIRFGTGKVSFNVSPNPAKEVVQLNITSGEKIAAEVMILDDLGRMVAKSSLRLDNGTQVQKINASTLLPGIYYCVINAAGERLVQRFIKL